MAGRSRLVQRIAEGRLTYKKLAKLVGVSVSAVYRWVHGIHEPRHYQRHALAEALDVPIDQLDWYLVCDDQPAAPALRVRTTLPAVAGSVSDVDRREMLTTLGGTFAAGAVFNFTGLFNGPRDVSPDLTGYFFDQLAEHNKANQQIGARPLVPTVVAQYALIRQAVDAAAPAQRTDLLQAQIAYAEFVGWLHQDIGDPASSLRWHKEALSLARQLGDPNHLAHVLAALAFLYAADMDDNHAGIEAADLALSIPGVHGPARITILRSVTRTYAQAGTHDALERALDEEADHGNRYRWQPASPFGGPTPFAMSSAYVNARRATCHLRTGHHAEAAELLESGTNAYQPGVYRDRSMWHTRHAHALLKAEGPQAALQPALQPALDAIDCLNRAPSARVRRELTLLRTQIPADAAGSNDLDELLQPI